ncbi:lysosome-associated membrane glycoprotein 2 isoform X2 [Salarias fasciatus]|uniref:lysosome-associated membrane glycoprotein 2 isoform X2 n=1 Tax=Salarias fasciatus TaxID=181472 RepID=UPI001177067B|nr:lysosome-associated membrane glycoprotein 2 isoform X2 [Salarias fasciatus]
MSRNAALVVLIAVGAVFQLSCGTQVSVVKDDKLCLFANLTLRFSVSYEVTGNKSQTVAFELPEKVTSEGSTCDSEKSTLKINFGDGHSFSVNFSASSGSYQADLISFSYNLNDSTVFNNSVSEETATVTFALPVTQVALDTCYSCNSRETIQGESVNMTFWNVLIQAFITNGSKSEDVTSCPADEPTAAPPTPTPAGNGTTAAPPTNATTVAPTPAGNGTTAAPPTNTTSVAPPTTPTPPLPTPKTGNYSVKAPNQTEACLLAKFGLRIGYKQGDKFEEMNFEPTGAQMSGSCGVNSSELMLESGPVTLVFTFINDTKKFRLHTLNVTVKTSSGSVLSEGNASLSLWEAALGSSYMCNKEQNFTISEEFHLSTFEVQVQPFGVKKGLFSTAEECFLDSDLSFLVPIAVGVALSFLIILVLISYLIGRRKSRTGYQSV